MPCDCLFCKLRNRRKIKQDDVDKLKQLDRIEYKQARYELDKTYSPMNLTVGSVYMLMFILLSLFIVDIWLMLKTGKSLNGNLYKTTTLILFQIYIPIMFILDIMFGCMFIYRSRKINEKYFGK
jgi:hypothetical protein